MIMVQQIPAEATSASVPHEQKQPRPGDRVTDIEANLGLLTEPGSVFELRSPNCPQRQGKDFKATYSANCNDVKLAAKIARQIDACEPAGVYMTLNPITPALLARSKNKAQFRAKNTTTDADIVRRRWLMIDVDSVRPAGVSATADETMSAVGLGGEIRRALTAEGWPQPVRVFSGNGCYLLFRVDLSNCEESTKLIRSVLNSLHQRFSTEGAEVDRSTFNAARIAKVPGTHGRKGSNHIDVDDPTQSRPHRQSFVIWPDANIEVVPVAKLEELASQYQPVSRTAATVLIAANSGSTQPRRSGVLTSGLIARCRAYVDKIAPAVEGQQGSCRTLEVAATCARFGLAEDDALGILAQYNLRCMPPWDERDLERKLNEGYRVATENGEIGKLAGNSKPHGDSGTDSQAKESDAPPTLENYTVEIFEEEDQEGKITEKRMKVGRPIADIAADVLDAHDGWPKSISGQLFVVRDDRPQYLERPSDLFAWLGDKTPPKWGRGETLPTKEELFAGLAAHTEDCIAIETSPHFPPLAGHYYIGDLPAAGDGSSLSALLDYLSPETPADRSLLQSLIMTVFWGGAPGTRPGYVITSPDGTGAGKTTTAQLIASLVGGAIELSRESTDERIRTSLVTSRHADKRIVLLDNARDRIASETIESLITSPQIAGHQLHRGHASRPNVLTWIVTANAASLSRDLAERCVTISLSRPTHSGTWLADVTAYIDSHRDQIIGDVRGLLEASAPPIEKHSRWSAWESCVLAHLPDPARLQSLIASRARDCDSDDDSAGAIADYLAERLRFAGYDPETAVVHIPSRLAAVWIADATGDHMSSHAVSRLIDQLHLTGSLPQLMKNPSHKRGRGLLWCVSNSQGRTTDYDIEARLEKENWK